MDVPLGPGLAALARMRRRGRAGAPAVVHGERLLILLEPGCAEEVPRLLRWLGWGHLDGVLRPGRLPEESTRAGRPPPCGDRWGCGTAIDGADPRTGPCSAPCGAPPTDERTSGPAADELTLGLTFDLTFDLAPGPTTSGGPPTIPRQRTTGPTHGIGATGGILGIGPASASGTAAAFGTTAAAASGTAATVPAAAPWSWLCWSGLDNDSPAGLDLRTQDLPWMLDTLADACARALLHPTANLPATPATGLTADLTIGCLSADQVA